MQAVTPEISQELKTFFREHKYVNICMHEGCIKKCTDTYCRTHVMHKCKWPGCTRNIINPTKEFCGVHTPEARAKNLARLKEAREEFKRLKAWHQSIAETTPEPGNCQI